MFGYHGKFLSVDLSKGEMKDMSLDSDVLKKYIGGSTLAARLIYNHVDKGVKPLDPQNHLVFATGPFTGSPIPMVSRSAVCGISPATGIWGEATTGGFFPVRLKSSGYDGIFIVGRAAKPVYLSIINGKAEIKDAKEVWGKDVYETQGILKRHGKETNTSVSCIGGAGEKLLRYACIMNDGGRASGRCGLGALMGSKRLKAIVVGGKIKVDTANDEKLRELTAIAREHIAGHMMTQAYREYGTNMWMDFGMRLGDVPAKYFTKNTFPAKKLSGGTFREVFNIHNYACHGCPIGCGRVIPNFTKDIKQVDGPEYETTAAFGPLCMNFDLQSVVMANHLCNVHGIDTISAGVSIAFAMYLYEKGKLTKEKAGMEIKWGDGKAVVRLVKMILAQKGIGRLLSQGTRQMAKELGISEDEAAHVKGLEIPMHDPRAFVGMALTYATAPRGACHLQGDFYTIDTPRDGVPELGIFPGDKHSSVGKAEQVVKFQNYNEIYNSLALCKFSPLTSTHISEMLSSITGWECTPEDLLTFGERSVNLKRAINNKLGVTRRDDKLPRIVIKALNEGATAGQSPDMNLLLKDYYRLNDWDWNTGKPAKKKLLSLGLDDVARDLWK